MTFAALLHDISIKDEAELKGLVNANTLSRYQRGMLAEFFGVPAWAFAPGRWQKAGDIIADGDNRERVPA